MTSVWAFLKLNTLQKYTGKELVFRNLGNIQEWNLILCECQIPKSHMITIHNQSPYIIKKNTAPTTPPQKNRQVQV